jgi:hypothetical protein
MFNDYVEAVADGRETSVEHEKTTMVAQSAAGIIFGLKRRLAAEIDNPTVCIIEKTIQL